MAKSRRTSKSSRYKLWIAIIFMLVLAGTTAAGIFLALEQSRLLPRTTRELAAIAVNHNAVPVTRRVVEPVALVDRAVIAERNEDVSHAEFDQPVASKTNPTQNLTAQTFAFAASENANVEVSRGCPARSDVRGNLGPASVITKEMPGKDWLRDRWQAAKDMSGTPLKGEHWLEIDLQTSGLLTTRYVVDFETASAKSYVLETSPRREDPWRVLASVTGKKAECQGLKRCTLDVRISNQHVTHTLDVHAPQSWPLSRYIRVRLMKPATQWGISVWRIRVFGLAAQGCS